MIELILRNLAITYYPVGICAMSDNKVYVETFEFKNLIRKINSAFSSIQEKQLNTELLNELQKNEIIKDIEEVTLESSDRCISYKVSFSEGNILYQLYIHLSVIVPYYYVYVLKNNFELEPYKWTDLPERDKQAENDKFSPHIELISNVLESKTLFTKFPDSFVKTIIPDVNYADVELGSFTYFNAFFLDDVNL